MTILTRNVEILSDVLNGNTRSSTARKFGISVTRVKQIIDRLVFRLQYDAESRDTNSTPKPAHYIDFAAGDHIPDDAKISDIQLNIRAINCLMVFHGASKAGEIKHLTDCELLAIPNLGQTTLAEIRTFFPMP